MILWDVAEPLFLWGERAYKLPWPLILIKFTFLWGGQLPFMVIVHRKYPLMYVYLVGSEFKYFNMCTRDHF